MEPLPPGLSQRRSRTLAAVVLGGLLLAGCGGTSDSGGTASPTGTPASSASTASARATFLELTAEHLCAVQAEVYPDAAALADAYETAPDYPGIERPAVRRLTTRLETDAGFARDLNDQVTATCGEDGPQG